MMTTNSLHISSGPHVRDGLTTQKIMGIVSLSLMPAVIAGVWIYGMRALLVILTSLLATVGTEVVLDLLRGRVPKMCLDGSAVVTGLMLALCLSADVPLYVPVLGGIFAILIVKFCFGGLGKNFMNPALAARCFLLISFPGAMTAYSLDGVSSATPIAALGEGKMVNITQMFLGSGGGVIGSSVLALLVGGMALWCLDIIHGEICFAVLGGFVLCMGLFGGQGFDPYFLTAHLCGGGVVMGAFFMATDYTTSPVSRLGQLVYGCLIGVLGAVFRICGTAADSFSYSILIGNLCAPLIDMFVVPKPYAFRKSQIALRNGEEKKPLMKRIPKPVAALTVIALLAGLALSGAYTVTKDTIDEQKTAAAYAAYQTVIPDAADFEAFEGAADLEGQPYGTDFGSVIINKVIVGKDDQGNVVGYAVSVTSTEGYAGNVTLSVGIQKDGTLHSISYTELNETPGKGMLCGEPDFMDQFQGKNAEKLELGSDINAVSGATVTSKASVNAVNAALDVYHKVIGGN